MRAVLNTGANLRVPEREEFLDLPIEYFLLKKYWVLLSLLPFKEGNITSICYKKYQF